MEAAEVCQIARLPEELLLAAICLTTPRDACRAAADSGAVWACFLPRDLPLLTDGELSHPPPSNKERFLHLADHPVVLADGLTSMWLDKETGIKCFMLSARKVNIVWGDTPLHWRWIPVTGSSFSEAAKLLHVWWLEIRGNMDSKMLSRNSTYGAVRTWCSK